MTKSEQIAQAELTDFNMESGFNGMDNDSQLISDLLNDDTILDSDSELISDLDFSDELEEYDFMD